MTHLCTDCKDKINISDSDRSLKVHKLVNIRWYDENKTSSLNFFSLVPLKHSLFSPVGVLQVIKKINYCQAYITSKYCNKNKMLFVIKKRSKRKYAKMAIEYILYCSPFDGLLFLRDVYELRMSAVPKIWWCSCELNKNWILSCLAGCNMLSVRGCPSLKVILFLFLSCTTFLCHVCWAHRHKHVFRDYTHTHQQNVIVHISLCHWQKC